MVLTFDLVHCEPDESRCEVRSVARSYGVGASSFGRVVSLKVYSPRYHDVSVGFRDHEARELCCALLCHLSDADFAEVAEMRARGPVQSVQLGAVA